MTLFHVFFFCFGSHYNENCDVYNTNFNRKQRLRSLGRCFICLRQGHTFRDCPNMKTQSCRHCTIGHHNRAICPQSKLKKKAELQAVSIVSEAQQLYESKVVTQTLSKGQTALLQTANAVIQNAHASTSKRARIFLDSASQRKFMRNWQSH